MLGNLLLATALSTAALASGERRPPWQPPKPDYGGATVLNPRSWMTFKDYPIEAVARNQQGYVVVAFTIGVDGRVSDCAVSRSSGYQRLDEVPCRLLVKRARFEPAKDANGAPRATRGTSSMMFWLPD